jgi:hypothetical protein
MKTLEDFIIESIIDEAKIQPEETVNVKEGKILWIPRPKLLNLPVM